eukprot:998245-Pyramimonas_sp.AAC.1
MLSIIFSNPPCGLVLLCDCSELVRGAGAAVEPSRCLLDANHGEHCWPQARNTQAKCGGADHNHHLVVNTGQANQSGNAKRTPQDTHI